MSAFDEMNTFVRVVEAGTISGAAEQLGLAKSGVSRRLADLENRLGVRLINRTTRRSSLTEAGRNYYRGAVGLLADVAELDALVADSECLLEGRLRLAAPLSFGLGHLTPAIEEFVRSHPGVVIDVDFSDHQVDLVAQGVDLAIRIAELRDSSLKARRICPIRLMLCARTWPGTRSCSTTSAAGRCCGWAMGAVVTSRSRSSRNWWPTTEISCGTWRSPDTALS
jgi:DNA-binding transcriptional LysR family regulator